MARIFLVFSIIFSIGLTVDKPIPEPTVISNKINSARLPYLTTDNKGNPVICWTEKDSTEKTFFYFSVSFNNGSTFETPKLIPVSENIKVHNESMPKVAFKKDGSIWAFYQTAEPGGHFSSSIKYTTSSDGGNSWSGSRHISSDSTTGKSRSFFDVATLPDGEIGIVYLDHNVKKEDKGRPVFFSKTNGRNIQEPIIVDPQACECCRTDIMADEKSTIHIVYRDLFEDGSRDMSYLKSSDGGKTFSSPTLLSKDGWKIDGCPHAGPSVYSHNSKIYAAWYTGKEEDKGVYYSFSKDGIEFNKRELVSENRQSSHVQLCLSEKGIPVTVWDESVELDGKPLRQVKLKTLNENEKTYKLSNDKSNASYPVILPLKENLVLVAWHGINEMGSIISYSRIKLSELSN